MTMAIGGGGGDRMEVFRHYKRAFEQKRQSQLRKKLEGRRRKEEKKRSQLQSQNKAQAKPAKFNTNVSRHSHRAGGEPRQLLIETKIERMKMHQQQAAGQSQLQNPLLPVSSPDRRGGGGAGKSSKSKAGANNVKYPGKSRARKKRKKGGEEGGDGSNGAGLSLGGARAGRGRDASEGGDGSNSSPYSSRKRDTRDARRVDDGMDFAFEKEEERSAKKGIKTSLRKKPVTVEVARFQKGT